MKLRNTLLALIILSGCSSQKNVVGCYSSNFAEMGFFGTHLYLNKDSTFDYRFAGDMVNEVGHGIYYLNRDTIILVLHRARPRSIADSLSADYNLKDTIRFYFQHKKIYGININSGKVVKYARGYSKRKKYFFFGSRYRVMRSYLQPHPCEIWKN